MFLTGSMPVKNKVSAVEFSISDARIVAANSSKNDTVNQLGEDAPKITKSENSSKMIPLTDQSVYMYMIIRILEC